MRDRYDIEFHGAITGHLSDAEADQVAHAVKQALAPYQANVTLGVEQEITQLREVGRITTLSFTLQTSVPPKQESAKLMFDAFAAAGIEWPRVRTFEWRESMLPRMFEE